MRSLQRFDFVYGEKPFRTVIKNRQAWFVAKDVCEILGLENVTKAVERLEDDEKGLTTIQSLGGPQETNIINEPGLYSLVFTSRKPEAKIFKRWVTHEVLPAIRKTGSYSTKRSSSPWMDSLSAALRQDEKLHKKLKLPSAELIRLRVAILRQAQDETGQDFSEIISILEAGAKKQETQLRPAENALDNAVTWLMSFLSDDPKEFPEINKVAREQGIKPRTLRRAKETLKAKLKICKKQGILRGPRTRELIDESKTQQ
jgi:prophage antirepressor-like protein